MSKSTHGRLPPDLKLDDLTLSVAQRIANNVAHAVRLNEFNGSKFRIPPQRSKQDALERIVEVAFGEAPASPLEPDGDKMNCIVVTSTIPHGGRLEFKASYVIGEMITDELFQTEVALATITSKAKELPAILDSAATVEIKKEALNRVWLAGTKLRSKLESSSADTIWNAGSRIERAIESGDDEERRGWTETLLNALDAAAIKLLRGSEQSEAKKWLY